MKKTSQTLQKKSHNRAWRVLFVMLIALCFATVGCSDDDGDGSGADTTTTTSSGADMTSSSGGADMTSSSSGADMTSSSSGADMTSSSSADMTSSSGVDTTSSGDVSDDMIMPMPSEYAVLIIGELSDTPENIQPNHDGLAAGGEDAAKDLGDFGHDALLGTTLLGTTADEFLAIDRWDNFEGLVSFYSNPDFAMAFGELFSSEPEVTTWVRQEDWYEWGDLDAGDGSPDYYFVVIRGRLAESDPEAAREGHDAVAAGGEMDARALGDVAHVVFLNLEDPQQFLAIDIWTSSDNIEALYTDPNFTAAFGTLFDGTPTLSVYHSTDWHQW